MARTARKTAAAKPATTSKTATAKTTGAVVNTYESADLIAPKATPTLDDAKKAYAAEGKQSATLARIVYRLTVSGTTVRAIGAALMVSTGTVSNWTHAGALLDRIDAGAYKPTVRDGRAALTVGQANAEKRAEMDKKYPGLGTVKVGRTAPATGASLAEKVRTAAEQSKAKRRATAKKAAQTPRVPKPADGEAPKASPSLALQAAGKTNDERARAAHAILKQITGGVDEEFAKAITIEAERIAREVAQRITAEVAHAEKQAKANRAANTATVAAAQPVAV